MLGVKEISIIIVSEVKAKNELDFNEIIKSLIGGKSIRENMTFPKLNPIPQTKGVISQTQHNLGFARIINYANH